MSEFRQLFGGVVGGIVEEPLVPEYLDDAEPIELPGEPVEKKQPKGLPGLTDAQRADSESYFAEFCGKWVKGFGNYEDDQPDRLGMIQEMGNGKALVPVLIRAYEVGSLQRLIEQALNKHSAVHRMAFGADQEKWLDWCDLIAANMVQISHMGAPDLAGTYDYSTKWRN